ncbi:MAG: enoyl-CoA hydratase-related protein [Beijerinckiaceae bacterium]
MVAEAVPTHSARLRAEIAGPVATVTIDAPERRNCVDLAAWRAFPPLFEALGAHDGVRAIVLRGAGTEAFCAGADIAEFDTERATADGSRAYEVANVAAFEAVAAAGKPVIAAIRGYCFGAGVGLAASADIRIATDDALFSIPAARLGVGYPPAALRSLVALMGPEAVKRLFFAAGRLDARQALAAGLVGEVVATDAVEARVAALAAEIAAGAPLTITAAKRAIDAAAGLPQALPEAEIQALADGCFASTDYAEGRAAFREKRKPTFRGE